MFQDLFWLQIEVVNQCKPCKNMKKRGEKHGKSMVDMLRRLFLELPAPRPGLAGAFFGGDQLECLAAGLGSTQIGACRGIRGAS